MDNVETAMRCDLKVDWIDLWIVVTARYLRALVINNLPPRIGHLVIDNHNRMSYTNKLISHYSNDSQMMNNPIE